MALVAATAFFFVERDRVAGKWKTSLTVSGLVTLIAAVHYFYMRDVWVATGTSPTVFRYIDWLLTVPLLMIEFYLILSAVTKVPAGVFWRLLIGSIAMLGFGYIFLLRKGWDLGIPIQKVGLFFENLGTRRAPKVSYRRTSSTKPTGTNQDKKETLTQEEVDKILDKIADKGYDGLTKEEKRKLFEYSKK